MGYANHIAIGVGLLFVATAVLKVLHLPDVELCQFMISQFKRYAEVFPFQYIGITIQADFYRTLVGVVELITGALLAFGAEPWRSYSAVVLLGVMIGAAQTNYAVGELNVIGINVVLGALLLFFLTRKR